MLTNLLNYRTPLLIKIIKMKMTRKEYELLYNAFKNYRVYMSDDDMVMSENILDRLFYFNFDQLPAFNEEDTEENPQPHLSLITNDE